MHTGTFQEIARGESLTLEKAIDAVARTRLFEFARRQFLLHFNAEIADDTPSLIGAFDREATLIATFGLRDAGSGFFCEHYLDAPIEQVLGESNTRCGTRSGSPV